MFITYQQTSEQSYLLNYGEDINIITNKKVICHFKYLIKNKFNYIFNVVPSFNKLLIVFDINFKDDVEILILLKKKNIFVKELPVKWEHKSGSKINLFTDSLIMLKNIIRLKKKYKI